MEILRKILTGFFILVWGCLVFHEHVDDGYLSSFDVPVEESTSGHICDVCEVLMHVDLTISINFSFSPLVESKDSYTDYISHHLTDASFNLHQGRSPPQV